MNPLMYSLCHKPVIGLMMFASSLCVFPPLFEDQSLPLQQTGASLIKEFKVPVGKPYFLEIGFEFPSAASIRSDDVAGERYDANCERDYAEIPQAQRIGLGRPIPIHVLVREKLSGNVTMDKVFNSLCIIDTQANPFRKTRTVGRLDLLDGKYVIEVDNIAGQAGLDGVTTTVSLVAGHGK
jgi:hypothetical protein